MKNKKLELFIKMKFNFNKKCAQKKCIWVVWDGCIKNNFCFNHCHCPESTQLKDEQEWEYQIKKQKHWEQENKKKK
jgi:hypothetical protein